MVCCFAVTQYGCSHSQLQKTGCTKSCHDFCQPAETLLVTKSCFPCGSCIKIKASQDRNEASIAHEAAVAAIEEKISVGSATRSDMLYNARARYGWLADSESRKRNAQVYEAEDAEQWTLEYAETIWDLKHGGCRDTEGFERDLHTLLEMKPRGLRIVEESEWYSNEVDSIDERLPRLISRAIAEKMGVTNKRELMPSPPLPARGRAQDVPDGELMPPPPVPMQGKSREMPLSPPSSATHLSSRSPSRDDSPVVDLPLSPKSL
ncbi:hypothetical protein V2A60_007346 [Cordyceps javanica]